MGSFQEVNSPRLTIATKQLELVHKLSAELGMTPSSRSRVETIRRSSGRLAEIESRYFNHKPPSDRFSNIPKPWEFTGKDEFFDD